MTNYPTSEEVLQIHKELINEFGGAHGLKDPGMLEAALFRPQCGYYQDSIEEAAALMESLAINHPFIDGNKRVAFFVTDTFLRMNGLFIDCDDQKAYTHFIKLFNEQHFDFEHLNIWLRQHVQSSG